MSRSKFVPAVREAITAAVRAGLPLSTAANLAGVHRSQLYRWLKRGEDARPGTTARLFFDAVHQALGEAEREHVGVIRQAGIDGDWRASAWYLSHRPGPDSWTDQQRLPEPLGPIVVQLTLPGGRPLREMRSLPPMQVDLPEEGS